MEGALCYGLGRCLLLVLFAAPLAGCQSGESVSEDEARSQSGASPSDGYTARWDNVTGVTGHVAEVCGPLAGFRETDTALFLNIGEAYPDARRFVFVVWGGKNKDLVLQNGFTPTLCATGEVSLYEGIPQMELTSVDELEIRNEGESINTLD
jgi:hypothetical protein